MIHNQKVAFGCPCCTIFPASFLLQPIRLLLAQYFSLKKSADFYPIRAAEHNLSNGEMLLDKT
jgi:hypothetical protein